MAKKTKIDMDSSANQRIRGQFVEREVKTCFSYEMEAIFEASRGGIRHHDAQYPLPDMEDIENFYALKCPECGEEVWDKAEGHKLNKCWGCKTAFDEGESEPKEIYEYWIVTQFFYEKLKAKGQPVLEWGNNYYWGRCTTGQAISMDCVIGEICEEMEILAGQKYSWEEK